MIPLLCLVAYFACATMRLRWLAFLGYFVVGFLLYLHHNYVVDGRTLVGVNSRHARISAIHEEQFHKLALCVAIQAKGAPDPELPPGWLEELPVDRHVKKAFDGRADSQFDRLVFEPRWHTPVTGIAGLRRIPRRAWFAGGRLSEADRRLELRDWPGG